MTCTYIPHSHACSHMWTKSQRQENWSHLQAADTHSHSWGKSKGGRQSLTGVKEERREEDKRTSAEWEAKRGWRGRAVGWEKLEGWCNKIRTALLLTFLGGFDKRNIEEGWLAILVWEPALVCLLSFLFFTHPHLLTVLNTFILCLYDLLFLLSSSL